MTNNFALIQFYPYTLAGSVQGALPGPINPVAFEIHVVDEEVGYEDEEEKANTTVVDLKTSLRQSCNNPKMASANKMFRGSHGNSSNGGGSDTMIGAEN